jgi:NAD(P)-dependent dehydrogenase (short-subunit alcohol dehydrogenase family)
MEFKGKTAIVTGGASGIGAALARKLATGGAHVVIADRSDASALASEIDGLAVICDVTRESDIRNVVAQAETRFGPVDIFVSNAGLGRGDPGHAASAPDADWTLNWNVHVMSHVYAARAVLPSMIERGDGYLVNMSSAAGLLNQIGDAAYSATKHAAVGFAEALAITHQGDGVKVSVVCPQYVATPLIGLGDADADGSTSLKTTDQAADAILQGMRDERFLILTHPEVRQYVQMKATDHDAWIDGMCKLRAKAIRDLGGIKPQEFHKIV